VHSFRGILFEFPGGYTHLARQQKRNIVITQNRTPASVAFLIGVDCAAQDRNMGLALGEASQDTLLVRDVVHSKSGVLPILVGWIQTHDPAIIALDAPLGWPASMGQELAGHQAGAGIPVPADEFFSRHTDRVVKKITGKRPMEVGANLIGRTAHSAVNLLQDLRRETSRRLPLATEVGQEDETIGIEVYPALVLRSRGLSDRRYKGRGKEGEDIRRSLVQALSSELVFESDPAAVLKSDHGFDAMLCLLCALDFLKGDVLEPNDRDRAESEGWIWFKPPGKSGARKL